MTRARAPLGVWWTILLVATGVAEAVYAWRMPLPELATLVPDDSYFYLQVASWFVDHGSFAFGPGDETYGFQPLWQLVVIGLAYLTPDRAALLYATLMLCVALRTLTGVLLFRLGRELWGNGAGVGASAVWAFNPAIAVWSWGLKENTLYAALLVVAGLALVSFLRDGRRALWLGVWLGLAVVTRVNAVVLVAAMLLVALVAPGRWPRTDRARQVLATGVAALVVAAPWYLFARMRFGTMLPTSGVWKLEIGRAVVARSWQVEWGSLAHALRGGREAVGYLVATITSCVGPIEFLLVGAAAAWGVAWPFVRRRRRVGGDVGSWSVPLGLAGGAVAGTWLTASTLVPYLAYAKWYTVPEFVVIALAAGLVLGRAAGQMRFFAGRLALAATLTLAFLVWPGDRWRTAGAGPWLGSTLPDRLLERAPAATQTLELGLWAARHVPAHVTLGMVDPGAITYFSGCRVVSLDPLMNSLDYQREGLRDPATHFVRTCRRLDISHIVGSGYRDGDAWVFRGLPPDTYDVLWVPFPDFPLPWVSDRPLHLMVVRLRDAEASDFLRSDMLPYGVYRPNDAQAVRVLEATGRPATLAGDALRLRTDGIAGTWSLWSRGRALATAAVGGDGWAFFDLRQVDAAHPELRFDGERTLPPTLEAYAVDFTFPPRR